MTTFSYFLGQKEWPYVWKSLKSGVSLIFILFLFLSIPLVLFHDPLITWIMGSHLPPTSLHSLSLGCYWLWLFFIIQGVSYTSIALLTALKESVFIAKWCLILNVLLIYFPFLFAFQYRSWGADKIWMLVSMCPIGYLLVNIIKIRDCYHKSPFSHFQKVGSNNT